MMKKIFRFSTIALGVLSMCLLITACGGQEAGTADQTQAPQGAEGESPSAAGEEQPELQIPEPEAGDTLPWVDGSLLVYIPPGEFVMGFENLNQNPQHTVYLDGFWIYSTEVTYAMYLNCIAKGMCSSPEPDPSIPDIEDPDLADRPVVNVRWDQAAQYCGSVGGTLPTEAQWELAARGFQSLPFPWGWEDPDCSMTNYDNCLGKTSAVNAYDLGVSPLGVYDTAGNVMEWVADYYEQDYEQDVLLNNPTGPAEGAERSVRGSTYASGPEMIPVFLRSFAPPEQTSPDLGFRCVVANAQEYAPPCQVLAYVPPDVGVNPKPTPWGLSECFVSQPEITYTTYCHEGEQRSNISWVISKKPSDSQITSSALVYDGAWCTTYDADTIICGGPSGGYADIEVCISCKAAPASMATFAACDPPYVLDETTSLCVYDGNPTPGQVLCAPGFNLNASEVCCEITNGTPLDYPACSVNETYDPTHKWCVFTLPTFGDRDCSDIRVYFSACEKEDGGKKDTGGSVDPCSAYDYNDCRAHSTDGCGWDYGKSVCFTR